MKTYKGLPLWELTFEQDWFEEALKMSIVDKPAVDINFLAFKNAEKKVEFAIQNEEKHIIEGVCMRANYPIYRNDSDLGEYFVEFSPETIEKIATKFLENRRFNLQHSDDSESLQVLQSYIINRKKGLCPVHFSDIEDGSWVMSVKVNDEALWKDIKEGKFNGFSVESYFDYQLEFNKIQKHNKNMTLSEIRAKLAEKLLKCGSAVAIDAEGAEVALQYAEETLSNGTEVFVIDENGALVHPADGEYTIEDTVWTVAEGIAEIKRDADPEDEPVEEPAAEEPVSEPMADEEPSEEPAAEEPKEEPVEEPAVEEPKEEPEQEEKNLLNEIVALTQRMEVLEGIIEELNKKMATIDSTPIAEPFNKVTPRSGKDENPYAGMFDWKK